ncbi:MAG: hypothetical protein OHK0018_13440 [Erythrobacter tepidarius]
MKMRCPLAGGARNLLLAAFLSVQLGAVSARAQSEVGRHVQHPEYVLLDGKTLPANRTTGKVVMVVFWATWCPVCVHELPEMQRLYEAYRKKGLEIVALSLDEDAETVREFWRKAQLRFPVAMRSAAARQAFGPIRATPTTVIVDRAGVVREHHLGGMGFEALEKAVRPLL